jgi:hypothetical protein
MYKNTTEKTTLERAISFLNMCEKHGFDENNPMNGYTAREMKEKMRRCNEVINNSTKISLCTNY